MNDHLLPSAKGISQIGAYFEDKSGKGFSFCIYVTFFKEREPWVWISEKKYKRYSRRNQVADIGQLTWVPDGGEFTSELHYTFTVDEEETYPVGLKVTFSWDFRSVSFVTEERVRDAGLADALRSMHEGVIFRDGVKTNPVEFHGQTIDLSEPQAPSQAKLSPQDNIDEDVPF